MLALRRLRTQVDRLTRLAVQFLLVSMHRAVKAPSSMLVLPISLPRPLTATNGILGVLDGRRPSRRKYHAAADPLGYRRRRSDCNSRATFSHGLSIELGEVCTIATLATSFFRGIMERSSGSWIDELIDIDERHPPAVDNHSKRHQHTDQARRVRSSSYNSDQPIDGTQPPAIVGHEGVN